MAPLFGKDDQMKQVGKDMQNLSDQIGALQKQLAEKNTQLGGLQKELEQSQGAAQSSSDTRLQQAQAQIQQLQQQIAELQARSQRQEAVTQQARQGDAQGLTVGGSAWVTRAGGLPLRLRSGPSLEGDILGKLQPGTQMTLLGGPQPADGHAWWHIRTNDGREGWVAGEDLRTQPD